MVILGVVTAGLPDLQKKMTAHPPNVAVKFFD
jgi:hypothetical protein